MKANWSAAAEAIRLEEFNYDLPDERIARYPVEPRDSSKLLTYKDGRVDHRQFTDLPGQLPADTLLVFNNTKVIPARARFQKETGAQIEILFLHPEQPTRVINDAMLVKGGCVWECMIGNKKRWKLKDVLKSELLIGAVTVSLSASYADYEHNLVQLNWNGDFTFLEVVQALGQIPLPPYLNRETEERDLDTYQTVYAKQNGAVAAPTAGLHFTDDVFAQLAAKGVKSTFLTLHVGAGTFQPIKASSVTEHRMHSEQVVYTRALITELLSRIDTIIPVGTTSLRSLESLYWYGVKLIKGADTTFFIAKLYPYPFEENELPDARTALEAVANFMDQGGIDELVGETEIFIFPGYQFRVCQGIVTNFHQPGSTLILLIAAMTGNDWKNIYDEALANDYRFLSYGDSSLLWRAS